MEQLKLDKKQLKIQLDDKCALVDDLTTTSLAVQKEVLNNFNGLTGNNNIFDTMAMCVGVSIFFVG